MVSSTNAFSDPDTYWVVESKFEPVRPAKELVLRQRLLRPLLNAGHYKVTLISAPAGYGKSSLLGQWAAAVRPSGTNIIWLTMEKSEADPKQYLAYLVFALQRAGVDMQTLITAAKNHFPDSKADNIVNLIERAVRQSQQQFVLVLEDYHSAECTEINHITTRLIKESGPDFSLIIDSRKRPQLEIFSLIALGEAQEVGPNELRMTEQETYAALRDISSNQAREEIYAKTEGWPVAVQLARIQKKRFPSQPIVAGVDGGVVACYLAEQVLSFLDQASKNFLLAVSFLDRFNAALTNHVLADPTSWQQIETLSSFYALFVPLDQEGGWYRLHHLFAEYLRDLQRKHDQHIADSYLVRASEWYENRHNLVLAAQYAARADRFDLCEQIIQRAGGWRIILYQGIEVLRSLLRLIPNEYQNHAPQLLIAHAYLHCKDGAISEARGLIEEARQQITPERDNRLEIDLLVIETLIYLYEDQALPSRAYQQALAKYQGHPQVSPLEQGIFRCFKLLNKLAEGELAEAGENLHQAFAYMRQSGSVLGLNYCYVHAALLALLRADLQVAGDNINRALKMAEENFGMDSGLKTMASLLHHVLLTWKGLAKREDLPKLRAILSATLVGDGWVDIYISGTQAAVMLARQLGEEKQAEEILQDVIHHAKLRDLQRLEIYAEAEQATLLSGASDKTEQLVKSNTSVRNWRTATLLAGKLTPESDNVQNDNVVSIQDFVAQKGIKLHQLSLHLTRVGKQQDIAFSHLRKALQAAARDNLWGPFLASSQVLQAVKKFKPLLTKQGEDTWLIGTINEITLLEKQLTRSSPRNGLSERELEIIQLLVSGYSNKEIARALALTENTVKFHLKNIFAKLCVKKRTQVVVQAQALGLIE